MKKKEQSPEGGVLVDAAKVIGRAVGKVATLVGVAPAVKVKHPGRFVKKNKHKLPRREKKALLRSAGKRPAESAG
jgi:hypothetical protein